MNYSKSFLKVVIIAVLMAGCATIGTVVGPTPESQIANGANAHKAASTLGTVLLRNGGITVSQAKGFSTLLHAASTTLDQANATLVACRKTTGSTHATSPDPCSLGVKDLIGLALGTIDGVQKALEAK